MRKVPTRKQILNSEWNDFLNFVLREKLTPNDIETVAREWKIRNALLQIIGSIDKDLYGKTSSIRKMKIQGLSSFLRSKR